jgi:Aminoglycoside-2''-adenylyltransferase
MNDQLVALASLHELLERNRIEYWLFGGWAVDFYAGEVTRKHGDVDIAVWLRDHERIAELLAADGWKHAPEEDEDGGTGYERDGVRLEVTFLTRGNDGAAYVPLHAGPVRWTADLAESSVAELNGVTARLISFDALRDGKSRQRDDADDAAKDRADFATLTRLR